MKKICFVLFLAAALTAFCLFSCRQATTLYDALDGVLSLEKTLPAGSVFRYGRHHHDSAEAALVADFLGLDEAEISDTVEEFCVYSSLPEAEYELLLCRVYRFSDAADLQRLLNRRAEDSRRALTGFCKEIAETTVFTIGNTVVLCRMPDNASVERAIRAAL